MAGSVFLCRILEGRYAGPHDAARRGFKSRSASNIALSRDIRRGDNSNAGIWCCASIVILSDMSMVAVVF
jgi:hypothetical protein